MLIDLLKKEKALRDKIQKNGGYGYMSQGNHLKEVLELNKQYRQENPTKYGYTADILSYIMEKETVPQELKDILDSQVFFSQRDLRKEKIQEHKEKMLAEGWMPLDKVAIDEALKQGKKLQVIATTNNDWMTVKIDNIYRPHIFNGRYGLMKPRAKSRGYAIEQFDNAFCKLI